MKTKTARVMLICIASGLMSLTAFAADRIVPRPVPTTLEGIRARILEHHAALDQAVREGRLGDVRAYATAIDSLAHAALDKSAANYRPQIYGSVNNLSVITDKLAGFAASGNQPAAQASLLKLDAALRTLDAQLAQASLANQNRRYAPPRTYRPRPYRAPRRYYVRPPLRPPTRIVRPPTHRAPPRMIQPPIRKSPVAPVPPARHKSQSKQRRTAVVSVSGAVAEVRQPSTLNPKENYETQRIV